MARRDDGAYWAYVTEEQRRQPGCPARELCESSRFPGTSRPLISASTPRLQLPPPKSRIERFDKSGFGSLEFGSRKLTRPFAFWRERPVSLPTCTGDVRGARRFVPSVHGQHSAATCQR